MSEETKNFLRNRGVKFDANDVGTLAKKDPVVKAILEHRTSFLGLVCNSIMANFGKGFKVVDKDDQ